MVTKDIHGETYSLYCVLVLPERENTHVTKKDSKYNWTTVVEKMVCGSSRECQLVSLHKSLKLETKYVTPISSSLSFTTFLSFPLGFSLKNSKQY